MALMVMLFVLVKKNTTTPKSSVFSLTLVFHCSIIQHQQQWMPPITAVLYQHWLLSSINVLSCPPRALSRRIRYPLASVADAVRLPISISVGHAKACDPADLILTHRVTLVTFRHKKDKKRPVPFGFNMNTSFLGEDRVGDPPINPDLHPSRPFFRFVN